MITLQKSLRQVVGRRRVQRRRTPSKNLAKWISGPLPSPSIACREYLIRLPLRYPRLPALALATQESSHHQL